MIKYLIDFATKRQLAYKQDSTGNMVIKRPGSGGGENAPVVVIQVTPVDITQLMQHDLATQAYMAVTAFFCFLTRQLRQTIALIWFRSNACVGERALFSKCFMCSLACMVEHAFLSMRHSACNVWHTLCSMFCSACILQNVMFSMHFRACINQTALFSMRCSACIVQQALFRMHCAAQIVQQASYSMHRLACIVQNALLNTHSS